MYFPLLIFLCAQALPSTFATHTSSHSHSITKRLHNVALKHSAGLANDLRVAFGGVLLTRGQQTSNSAPQKRAVYCVSQQPSKNGGGAQVPFGGNNGTTDTRPSSTSGSRTATSTIGGATPSSTSSGQLAEAHVSPFMTLMIYEILELIREHSKGATSLTDGTFLLAAIPQMVPFNSQYEF